jgi:hypothetical protein
VSGKDGILLTAAVTAAGQQKGILNIGDSIKTHVDPFSLAPHNVDMRLTGTLGSYNQVVQFDQANGFASLNGANRTEIPVGTHSLLSLAYAIRSFSLAQSKNPTNPVNDTRVALYIGDKPYVLTLRPATVEVIEFDGVRIPTQVVTISTGNPQLDQLNFRIWIGTDERRLPLRLAFGGYQANLISVAQMPPAK